MTPISTVAIIGSGFTGSLLAIHLLRGARGPVSVVLLDRAGDHGRGLAYSTGNPHHVLNVRAANMSAFPDDRAHFAVWLSGRDEAGRNEAAAAGYRFAPRGIYGAYLQEQLERAANEAAPGVRLVRLTTDCIEVSREGSRWLLDLCDQNPIRADVLALCLGHSPPKLPPPLDTLVAGHPRVIRDPWGVDALSAIGRDDRVTILGTGLTMIDSVIALDDRGHRGPIVSVSRRGYRPLVHRDAAPYPAFLDPADLPRTVRSLYAAVRREIRRAADAGGDWRSVIDALRPVTIPIWKGLSLAEQQRFLRHVRPLWDLHRHRVAPEVQRRIDGLVADGRLTFIGGRFADARDGKGRLSFDLRLRASGQMLRFDSDWLINCSGPQTDCSRMGNPLLRGLLDRQLAAQDPLKLGLAVADDCRLLDAWGRAHASLFAAGPLTRGTFWEMTAVPELRVQAEQIAIRVLDLLDRPAPENAAWPGGGIS